MPLLNRAKVRHLTHYQRPNNPSSFRTTQRSLAGDTRHRQGKKKKKKKGAKGSKGPAENYIRRRACSSFPPSLLFFLRPPSGVSRRCGQSLRRPIGCKLEGARSVECLFGSDICCFCCRCRCCCCYCHFKASGEALVKVSIFRDRKRAAFPC